MDFCLFGMYEDSWTWQSWLSIWRNLEKSEQEINEEQENLKKDEDSQKGIIKKGIIDKFIDELKKVLTIGDNFMRWYKEGS